MQRGVAAIVGVVLLAGCGGSGKYAGLTREEAASKSIREARQMGEPAMVVDMSWERKRVPIGTWRSRNSHGQPAWLTVFRLTGVVNDRDQACVWVRREVARSVSFEEASSVAYGRVGDPRHDRCAAEVNRRGIAGPGQTMGSEVSSPPVATPQVVTPFGDWGATASPVEYSGGDGMTLTGNELLLPKRVPSGTCGFAGFVIDAATGRPLRGARVHVVPAGSGGGIVATTDEHGSFAFSGLPVVARGFQVVVSVAGYRTSRGSPEDCYPGDFAIGDWSVTRTSATSGR